MPDKELEATRGASEEEDDYHLPPDALPPLPEIPASHSALSPGDPLGRFRPESRAAFRYCSARSMDSTDSERPVSYSSTSSSASSRDSHCSLGSRSTLAAHCHPGPDRDAGAIRLELVPARQLECADEPAEGKAEGKDSPVTTPTATPTGPKLQYVDRVVQEILDTERTYVQDLRSIVQDYLDCISNQSRLPLGAEERGSLFGNIRDIYHFNSELLHDLEKCNADPVAIAECFVAKSEDFHIYTQYCTNYPRSVAVLTECMRNKALAKFFRERQESLRHSLPLGSYLLKPVQRILKYHLLLHEIANHLEKDTETYDVVLEAIDTMQRVAWQINDMKRKHEHAVRLQEVQSLLTNWKGPDLISYGELVLEGTFRIQRAKNERTLFLFDRLLLITKKREESYTYKAHILCCNLMLVELIPKEPLSFSVFHYKNPKLQHTVQAKSQQDKRMWILHLKRLILENHPAKIPAKAKQAILEMDAVHHPGFHYSPEGEKKPSPHAKEGPTTRRVRRKSEPLSKLLKNSKQGAANPDAQKRSSLGMSLLSPVSGLSPREGLLASIGRTRSLVNQSEESLDPGDPSDVEDSSHLQDADDEDETGPGTGKKFKIQAKGARKRLNPQVSVDSIDKWQNFNISPHDLQAAKESLQMDAGHVPIHSVSRPSDVHGDPHLASVLGSDHVVRNIWTDHQIRRAMFPTRQQTIQGEDEEDIYQMFLPSEPPIPDREESPTREGGRPPGRPCSWHVEQTQTEPEAPPAGRKVMRRASSVGEKQSESKAVDPGESLTRQSDSLQTETSSNVSGSDSAEQLTIDDIENVYDNISYEDLKSMGLIRRDQECTRAPQEVVEEKPKLSVETTEKPTNNCEMTEPAPKATLSSESNKPSSQDTAPLVKCDLQIMEENIYDTIGLLDQPPAQFKGEMEVGKMDSLQGLESDYAHCDSLVTLISEESLQNGEHTTADHSIPAEPDTTSSNSDSLSCISAADKMSEQVDEIWNDLENYIKKNEKKQDRLTAAFPVSRPETLQKAHTLSVPTLVREKHVEEDEPPSPPAPVTESLGTVKSVKNKLARLSSGSFRFDDGDTQKDRGLLGLSSSLFPGDLASLDNTVASTSSILSDSNMEIPLEWGDKTKNRVFLMARQYSQKIKKANQLLKMKSPEQEHMGGRIRTKQKDLAAILEEKKQGGAAIGARIAEYSQLYEQIMFKEVPADSQKKPHRLSGEPQSQRSSQCDSDSKCLEEDWLNSTYSNGELADFVSWPNDSDLRGEGRISTPQCKLTPACSVPALKSLPTPPPPTQRWSACINQPNKENLSQEHIYNSLGRRPASSKALPYSRCQSSSSIVANGKTPDLLGNESSQFSSSRGSAGEKTPRFPVPGLAHSGRQFSLPEKSSNGHSDLTLQDTQQVVVVNRHSPLSAHRATQNYLANFKDTGDDDDEDYVEIKSEDEDQDSGVRDNAPQAVSTPCLDMHCNRGLMQSQSLPCTPIKTCHANVNPVVSLSAFTDQGKLNNYLWNEPQATQQNIVQSLREKFQCLSSSSFA
ncbi:pleckstrin homology domain-containing family G member 1 isoform X1 [Megalops cyprinoides]|uniref:pleckstrin homology domain-containing family G member 1 isoform X1 n=2 Tax=Megalops cyprinoides TaxID=118141 RepID=UPI0018648412|nr:pleckstrin homology domain-containing family G member 1 isoform X1 [Megalops cyprinoides]